MLIGATGAIGARMTIGAILGKAAQMSMRMKTHGESTLTMGAIMESWSQEEDCSPA
jgi:hypothetical protein